MKRIGSMMIVALFVTAPMTACSSGDSAVCNDGVLEGREACDLNDLDGESCITQGFTGGSLSCNLRCDGFETSMCTTCGNGAAEGMEDCDGADLNNGSCTSEGFSGGAIACTAACTYDTTGCTSDPVCNNDVVEGTEVCDGADLDGESCTTLSFDGGTLSCNSTCSGFDTSLCTGSCTEVTPATCDDAHGFEGCCTGNIVYWWEGGALGTTNCDDDGSICGWNATEGAYWCNGETTGADPAQTTDPCAMYCGGTNPYGGC